MRKTDTNPDKTESSGGLKLPTSLSLKDLVTIVSVAVSLTLAWGVFSTRIAVLEQETVAAHQVHERDLAEIKQLQQDLSDVQNKLNDHIVDDGFMSAGKQPPRTHR